MTVCSMTRSKVKVTSRDLDLGSGHTAYRHEPLKVGNSAIFKGYLLLIYKRGWQMTTDSYIKAQYLKLIGAGFFIFCPSFCVT